MQRSKRRWVIITFLVKNSWCILKASFFHDCASSLATRSSDERRSASRFQWSVMLSLRDSRRGPKTPAIAAALAFSCVRQCGDYRREQWWILTDSEQGSQPPSSTSQKLRLEEKFEFTDSTITNETMSQENTNSSIDWIIELYNFYFAQISTKKSISKKLGFRIDNPIWTVFFCCFWGKQWVFKMQWLAFLLKAS